ncbi:MAG: adenylyl-sulfate kinase [Polyangiaceae bacterium]|nr:adenylyl-sulfate kinase [Polyangiaceae bacterium]
MTGVVVWLTGKPSAGKSTLARSVAEQLASRGARACLLDGDEVRSLLLPAPGYDDAARDAFYATLTNLAVMLAGQGHAVLVAATAHRSAVRQRARLAAPSYLEVFVDASDAEVTERDAKGLYRAVREGRAHGVPGADAPYERPDRPDVVARGGQDVAARDAIVDRVLKLLEPLAPAALRS